MEQEKKKRITKLIINLTAIVASIFVFSYAWLVYNLESDMDSVTVGTVRASNIQISEDGESGWGDSLNMNFGDGFIFNDAVSSNGIDFYKVNAKNDNGEPVNFVEAQIGKDYVGFDLWFKNDSTVGLVLNNDSVVSPVSPVLLLTSDDVEHTASDIERLSAYGNYTRDLIAASVRIAFFRYIYDAENNSYNLESTPILVWAPNKNYEIAQINGTYEANINSTNLQNYNYINVTSPSVFTEARVDNLRDEIHASLEEQNAYGEPVLAYIDTENGVEGKAGIRAYMWIEGNDRDTVNAVRGGLFNFTLSFAGIQKRLNDNIPEVTIDENSIAGIDDTMQYSIDLGETWTDYILEQELEFNSDDVVYVRYKENDETFASEPAVLRY